MSACANHPERAGSLAIDLPSIGVRTYLCPECNMALQAQLSGYTAHKGKREAWQVELAQGCDDNEYMRSATGRLHWGRAIY